VEYDVLPAIERIDARVSRLADLTDDVVEVTITPARRMPLLAGQYCRFTFRGFPSRAFSPTAPLDRPAREGRSFRLNVKRVRGGRVSPYFGRNIRVGYPVKVEGPFGSAFLRPGKTNASCSWPAARGLRRCGPSPKRHFARTRRGRWCWSPARAASIPSTCGRH
jgi:3-phenylpropionate/trans-cinnamate dioxygenase ferredoxin reductase subunit